jgi:nitrite reductase (NADH) small subunit
MNSAANLSPNSSSGSSPNSSQNSSPSKGQWLRVCAETDLTADTGVCVLFNGEQVAIFKDRKTGGIYALSNYDPIGKANVLSRGILGSIKDQLVVASPLYKQHFRLDNGQCLEDDCSVKTFAVRIENGEVQLAARA